MKFRIPQLRHSRATEIAFLSFGVPLALVSGFYFHLSLESLMWLFSLGLVLGGLLIKATPALATEFPNHDETVGDLARDVLAANHALLVEQVGGWSKHELWETLCRLIVNQTGVRRQDIGPEARIVHDLGIE